jgi:hypothetical protein
MRTTLVSLALAVALGFAPAMASAQPLYVPSGTSFGPATQIGPINTVPSFNTSYNRSNINTTNSTPTFFVPGAPYGVADFHDSALARGPNGYRDPHPRGLYLNGQPWIQPKGYQSVHDLMTQPRTSNRAPFQYLPTPR